MPTTLAIGYSLRIASVFRRTISPFSRFLCFFFHLWQDWSGHRNSVRHLNQSSLSICCIRLHLFLLYSSAFTKRPSVGKTTLDFMAKMLLGHIGCSLCTSSNVSTVKDLQFKIASVSSRSVLRDLSFRYRPCVCNKDTNIVRDDRICLSQTPPIWLDTGCCCAN